MIEDPGASSGTPENGEQIRAQELLDDGKVKLGLTEFKCQVFPGRGRLA